MDLEILKHSTSHIMAQAVKELYPEVKLGIGPAIENGFYYDFDMKSNFTPQDLVKIEEKMREIIKQNLPFGREILKKKKAAKLFKKLSEKYKLELLEEIQDEEVSIYKTGDKFIDLCKGPHIEATGSIRAFKLLSIAGAYWKGLETNPMLQRIYGAAFKTQQELDNYLKDLEELEKRDHRKLGPRLGLFDIYHNDAGAGLVFYYPNGAILRNIIEDYIKKEHIKRNYKLVITPHIMKQKLWKESGHFEHYKENMYTCLPSAEIEGFPRNQSQDFEYILRPMNCPGHILIYKSDIRSYRELPLRLFELGTVYRYEKSGVLHGLLRVRGFTQDDAHIFCTPKQLEQEISDVLDFAISTMKTFGFDEISVELSTRPCKSIGDDKDWDEATFSLEKALENRGLKYKINPGEGAFYGPKIDIKLKDVLKRDWQCATIQCDFALPDRFNLTYADRNGKLVRPIMLHRVILGSLERFMATLVENYQGDFPLWLSPIQVAIIPITDEQIEYAKSIEDRLKSCNIRVELDLKSENMKSKIRNQELKKTPYVLIVGKKEQDSKTVSVRRRKKGNLGAMILDEFISRINDEVENKKR